MMPEVLAGETPLFPDAGIIFFPIIYFQICVLPEAGISIVSTDIAGSENESFQLAIRIRNYNLKYDVSVFTSNNSKIELGLNLRTSILPPTSISRSDVFSEWQTREKQKLYSDHLWQLFAGRSTIVPENQG